MTEKMDREAVIRLLNEALPLQFGSAALYAHAAGSATGMDSEATAQKLWGFAELELEDARRLVEKVVALEGEPSVGIAPIERAEASVAGLKRIIQHEAETLDALRKVIPETGNDAVSEALEHRLEHIIMRKQEQVDFLLRLTR